METKKMGEIYQHIADKLDELIPEDWRKIYLYAEVLSDSTMVYFYFTTELNDELIYSLNIPKVYNISKKDFDRLLLELFNYFRQLHSEFKSNNTEVWSNLTFLYESTGKFNIEYNYDDVLKQTTTERRTIWKYKYLGIYPSDEDAKKIVDEYIKSQGNN